MQLNLDSTQQSNRARPRFFRHALTLLSASLLAGWLTLAGDCAAAAEEEDESKPVDVTLKTDDGLELVATFYPSILPKKERKDAVPIVVLHAWKGDRGDCESIAEFLQDEGHAVITPDLRGHGQSTQLVRPDGSKGKVPDAGHLRPKDFELMVTNDLEAIKTFLLKKNNDGELNIERLGVMGAEMGAVVAINWAALDWSWPVLATGKQGQDVKALVLISPDWNFKGLGITEALHLPAVRSELSILIMAGKGNSKALGDAKKLHQQLERFHTDEEKKDLFILTPDTKLQGMKLLNEKSLNLDEKIGKFITLRLEEPKFEWAERKNPLK